MRFILLVSLAVVLSFCSNKNTASETETSPPTVTNVAEKEGVNVGDKAPSFNLKNIDGEMYTFDNITDGNGEKPKGYIVVFTCNTCPIAKMNEDRLIALHNTYATQGYPVVAIQPNDPAAKPGDSYESMISYAAEKGFLFTYLFDDGQKIYPQYGATRTPEVFLVDAKQIVRYHGAIDDSVRDATSVEEKFLENAIQAIENGKEPTPDTTKAVGCSIKTV